MIALSASIRCHDAPLLDVVERRFRALRSVRTPDGALIALIPFVGAVLVTSDAFSVRIDLGSREPAVLPAAIDVIEAMVRANGVDEHVAIDWRCLDRLPAALR